MLFIICISYDDRRIFKRSRNDIEVVPVKNLLADNLDDVDHVPKTMFGFTEEEKVCTSFIHSFIILVYSVEIVNQ